MRGLAPARIFFILLRHSADNDAGECRGHSEGGKRMAGLALPHVAQDPPSGPAAFRAGMSPCRRVGRRAGRGHSEGGKCLGGIALRSSRRLRRHNDLTSINIWRRVIGPGVVRDAALHQGQVLLTPRDHAAGVGPHSG